MVCSCALQSDGVLLQIILCSCIVVSSSGQKWQIVFESCRIAISNVYMTKQKLSNGMKNSY